VYNHFLALQQKHYQDHLDGKEEYGFINYKEMCKLLVALKAEPEYEWLREVNSHALQQTLKDLETAYKRFFAGKAAYPTQKLRDRGDSFRSPFYCAVSSDFKYIRSMKLGWVRCRGLRKSMLVGSDGNPSFYSVQSITVSAVADYFEASVLFRVPAIAPQEHPYPGHSCGLDVGIAKPVALTSCKQEHATYGITTRNKLQKQEAFLNKLHRKLARQQKGSSSRQRTKTKLARAYHHAACIRKNFNHKLSNALAETYKTIVVEDLSIRAMTASASGTIEAPGKNVKQKSALNRGMLRMAPGQLYRFLEYKCRREGGALIRVDPRYSSQECRICGVVDKRSRESQAIFKCVSCGHTENADYNAAGVVLGRGLNLIQMRPESALVESAFRSAKPKPRGL
jgi:putative transposase